MSLKERRKYADEHPVKSGNLTGNLVITVVLSIAFGAIASESISKNLLWGYVLSFVIFITILANSYIGIYKPVKKLESELYKSG